MDNINKIKPLIIFDRSGSMNTELEGDTRYNICKKIVEKFDFFDLWWFGDDVIKLDNQSKLIDVSCDQGTDIPNMLRNLCDYLNEIKPKSTYIILLTDDECDYDPNEFTYDFKKLDNNYYVVYDICGTNMEKLNTVFGNQVDIANDINGINKLINDLKEFIVKDQKLLENISQTDENLKDLKKDIEDLNNLINKLEEERNQINEDMYSNLTVNFGALFKSIFNLNKYMGEIKYLTEKHEKLENNEIREYNNKISRLEKDNKEAKKELELLEKGKKHLKEDRKKYFIDRITKTNQELKLNKEELKRLENTNSYKIKKLKTDGNVINILGKLIISFFGW
jgi:chromosome segregation ATPase